ncbi:MAG: GTPase [Candidatus Bathyarchaeia archaeon]
MRAWLCYLRDNPHDHVLYKLKIRELEALSLASGYEVVGSTLQTRRKPHPAYLMGSGKVRELEKNVSEHKVQAVIFYNILSSKQQYNLAKRLMCKVIDRYDLTLEIFERNSTDELSKLQIDLARVLKDIPRVKLLASLYYRSGREHPGPMSLGEYSYHKTLANLQKKRADLESAIEGRRSAKVLQLRKRKNLGFPNVCIAGYYNAGKTSLFNALTKLGKPVGHSPFTTLSSKYFLVPKNGIKFFLVDTIGFVVDLDPRLIASFSLTLDDLRYSDLVLFLVDVSDPEDLMMLRVKTCLDLIKGLGIGTDRLIVVLNKSDLVRDTDELSRKAGLISSAVENASKRGYNLRGLVELVEQRLVALNKANLTSETYVKQLVN